MTDDSPSRRPSERDVAIVTAQLGRSAREPWRVAARCHYGFSTVIVSPSRLADGTLFPTMAWLTCPYLAETLSAEESAGATARWATRAQNDLKLAASLAETDAALRAARAAESDDVDECVSVGLAGQRDPLGVKCLHAHVALQLIGIDDPVGAEELGKIETACTDARCMALMA